LVAAPVTAAQVQGRWISTKMVPATA
jgi:hypothetical protein